MAGLPEKMRALTASECTGPSGYVLDDVPTPTITRPEQVIIRVHAASLGGAEVKMTAGEMNILHKMKFPSKLGQEGSGTVVAIGSAVKYVKVGDEVYGLSIDKPMFRQEDPGWASQYAICDDRFLVIKPPHLSHESAAGTMMNTMSSYQAIKKGLELRGLTDLEGMAVYVPAGLGGLGSMGIQLAKKVFKAHKIITSVSTSKVPLVDQYLPGLVDQVVDYQTQTLTDIIRPGSVDFVLNTQIATLVPSISLINPSSGILISLASIPDKETTREIVGADRFPLWLGPLLDLGQLYYSWKLRGTNIAYAMVSGTPSIREDIEKVAELMTQEGLLTPIISTARLDDIEAVREACEKTGSAKGGFGKSVFTIV